MTLAPRTEAKRQSLQSLVGLENSVRSCITTELSAYLTASASSLDLAATGDAPEEIVANSAPKANPLQ